VRVYSDQAHRSPVTNYLWKNLRFHFVKKTLTVFLLAVLTGFAAHFYTRNWEQNRNTVILSEIQEDFNTIDSRIQLLLKQIETNEVSLSDLKHLWTNEQIGFVTYDNGIASNWTTNSIPFASEFGNRNSPQQGVVRLKNAWYLCRSVQQKNQLLVAYALIKTDYNFENRYIHNRWGQAIGGAARVGLTQSKLNTHPLLCKDGKVAVYLRIFDSQLNTVAPWSAALWFLFIALLLLATGYVFSWMEKLISQRAAIGFFVAVLLLFRSLMLWWQLPKSLYALELFGPSLHASTVLIPSLGDFLLHLIFLLIGIARVSKLQLSQSQSVIKHWLGIMLPVLLLWPVHYLFEILVVNSSFSFNLNNPFSLSVYSFIGLLVSFLILLNYFLLFRFLFSMVDKKNRNIGKLLLPWTIAVVLVIIMLGPDKHAIIMALTGGLVMALLMVTRNWAQTMRGFSLYTPTILIFSLLAAVLLIIEMNSNEQESRRALARKLEIQQDPITEYMFARLKKKILSDRGLRNTLTTVPLQSGNTLNILHQMFSYDHWNRYLAEMNVFNSEGGLMVSDNGNAGKNYFELQREFAASKPTLSAGLRYVGNWDADGGYLARIELKGKRSQNDLILFIRMIPETADDILGFTDLFIDEAISTSKELEGYSYALYTDGELQDHHGDFPYSLSAVWYATEQENASQNQGNYNHLVYRPMAGRLVVVTRKNEGLIGYLTIFSYLFLFYFFCATLIVIVEGSMLREMQSRSSFRGRINMAMSSMLFVSLLIIGLLTVFYVVREYHARNEEMISEKSRSVLIELEHKLRDRPSFSEADQLILSTLLNKFSKVFFTDINLYRLDGHLLATSRPRLFDEGLMSKVMDPTAYTKMRFDQQSSFIHEETIGELTYLTAYVPFRNEKREVIAFMSLPYFARQYGLQQEVFSLLAALTNIYVFLILASVVMALVIANRITEPLRIIRESLKNLKLNQTNRAIEWNSNDEIGELVEEYNRTLNELVQSAELLARSERESAWREMAKQVAHEIKNPLTPMKLSIQMLQRSLVDGAEDLHERIEKVSKTLIEQIDTLSNIASEFSSFAQMPKPVVEHLNLKHLMQSAVELHGNTDVSIELKGVVDGNCIVQADREQMQRVFTNLIKNGIQAIPEGRKGKITLGLIREGAHWVTSIKDNGSGIPAELEDRIFVPNFTTKTSGMGLGLAMVKNIIETVNGKIWFKTEVDIGTVFYISLPVVNPLNNAG